MFKRVMGDVTFGQVLIKVEDVLCWWLYIGDLDFERMVCILQTDLNHITVAGEDTLMLEGRGCRILSERLRDWERFRRGYDTWVEALCLQGTCSYYMSRWFGGRRQCFGLQSLCCFCNCCDFQVSLFFSLIGLLDCVLLWWDDKKMRRKTQSTK